MKTNLLRKGKWILAVVLMGAMVACSDDDELNVDESQQKLEYGYEVGDVLYHRFSKGGEIIEEVADSVVDFGTESEPAIFGVCISHQVRGKAVKPGLDDLRGVFQSLNYDEMQDFADVYAEATGDKKPGEVLSKEQRVQAFIKLKQFVAKMGQPALVYYLLKDDVERYPELKELLQQKLSAKGSRSTREAMEADRRLWAMAQELLAKKEGMQMASRAGEQMNEEPRGPREGDVITYYDYLGIAKESFYVFVRDGQKQEGKNDGIMISNHWIGALDTRDYNEYKSESAGPYMIYHGTKLTPLSGIEFHFDLDYMKYPGAFSDFYDTKPASGDYVSGYWHKKLNIMIDDLWQWPSQNCTGDYTAYGGYLDMKALESGILQPREEMYVDFYYGDDCCCHYHATVKFSVAGDSFVQEFHHVEKL